MRSTLFACESLVSGSNRSPPTVPAGIEFPYISIPWQMRNRTFHRHQPLTQIFIDTWIRIGSCHKKILWWLGWPNYSFCRRCGKPILAFLKKRRRLSPIEKIRAPQPSSRASLSPSLCMSAARLFSVLAEWTESACFFQAFPGESSWG